MPDKQAKPTKNAGKKKVSANPKKAQQRKIDIIKHFQPKIVYNSSKFDKFPNLPEVNTNIDITENLSTAKKNSASIQSKFNDRAPVKLVNKEKNNNRVNSAGNVQPIVHFKPVNRKISSLSTLKSKSCQNSNSLASSSSKSRTESDVEKKRPLRSKSFNLPKKTNRLRTKTAKNEKLTSTSESDYVEGLKKEIMLNISDSARPAYNYKIGPIAQSKKMIQSLREEINTLVNKSSNEKRAQVAELKVEIGEYRRNGMLAYGLSQIEYENDGQTQIGRCKPVSQESCNPDTENEIMLQAPQNTCSCKMPHKQVQNVGVATEKEASPSTTAETKRRSESTSPKEDRSPNTTRPTTGSTTSDEESLNKKIDRANYLIGRVRHTLEEIKKKRPRRRSTEKPRSHATSTSDKENVPASSESEEACQVQPETGEEVAAEGFFQLPFQGCPLPDMARPQTRRKCEDGVPELEKFRTWPKDDKLHPEVVNDYELLQAKLNTIIEHSETEASTSSNTTDKKEQPKAIAGVPSSTDHIPTEQKSTQVDLETTHSCVQCIPEADIRGTQTERKTLTKENIEKMQIAPKQLSKSSLSVQILPPINIPKSLQVQRVFAFSLDNDVQTFLFADTPAANVGFFTETRFDSGEVAKCDTPSVPSMAPTLMNVQKSLAQENASRRRASSPARWPPPLDSQGPSSFNEDLQFPESISTRDGCIIEGQEDREQRKTESLEDDNNDIYVYENFPQDDSKPRMYKIKSFSDSEVARKVKDADMQGINQHASKEIILKSYHIYDNTNFHDPGQLAAPSITLLSQMDPTVYKTYINPEGLEALKKSHSTDINHPSRLKKGKWRECTPSVTPVDSVRGEQTSDVSNFSRLLNLGLFSSKHTQCDFDKEKTREGRRESDENYERVSFSISYSSDESISQEPLTPEDEHSKTKRASGRSASEYGRSMAKNFSACSAYGDEHSHTKFSCGGWAGEDERSEMKLPSDGSAREDDASNTREVLRGSLNAEKVIRTVDLSKDTASHVMPSESRVFKSLRDKIGKEHPAEARTSLQTPSYTEIGEGEEDISTLSLVPDFITGLIDQPTMRLEKVIPKIRRNLKSRSFILQKPSTSHPQISDVPKDVDSDENSTENKEVNTTEDSRPDTPERRRSSEPKKTHKKESPKRNSQRQDDPTVMQVQVHGDYIPMGKVNKTRPGSINPLRLGENGRYKDEENLFCESNYPKYEDIQLKRRRLRYIPRFGGSKNYLNSSISDTATTATGRTDKSLSDGEVRCRCNVSYGEIHHCMDRTFSDTVRKSSMLKNKGRDVAVQKKRNYFSNWITYYLNKSALAVNNSTSSSTSK